MSLRLAPKHPSGSISIIRSNLLPSCPSCHQYRPAVRTVWHRQSSTVASATDDNTPSSHIDVNQYDHLNPQPLEYSSTPFTDACTLTLASGAGGHGCISFLREKYIANGPPNGGDGGTGGNVYIQAVKGETSLHKIARRRMVAAGRGKNGQGGMRGGKRGEDVTIIVPVGTVVREVSRKDPVGEELAEGRRRNIIAFGEDSHEDNAAEADGQPDQTRKWRRDRWLLYPGILPKSFTSADFPPLPRPRRSNLAHSAPQAPIRFDLDRPMPAPMLLAAGAMGGLGNPHFVTKSIPRPKFATKGDEGVTIKLQLELKLLADVGLVGLPNAGKSTLLRAVTSSRARVGDWAFTTLAPNIGTVVLDSMSGPSGKRQLRDSDGDLRTHFTIADIPGLIEGAHLDKGLGLDFLRHIERAAALAFVVDLSAGNAINALKGLWSELREYENIRQLDRKSDELETGDYRPFASSIISPAFNEEHQQDTILEPSLPALTLPPIPSKPWLVVATKADLPGSQDNFRLLNDYMLKVQAGEEAHPSGVKTAWRESCRAVPVCAQKKENTDHVLDSLVALLQSPSM